MDKKDLQLMELAAQNCRIPHTTLARSIAVSKDAITYRLAKLEAQSYIQQYVLFIDGRKLGFTRYHLLLRFDAMVDDKHYVAQRLATHPFVMWINTFIGRFDMQIIVDATDGFHLNTVKEELFTLCGHKVKEYIVLTHLSDLEFTQLNPVLDLGTKFQRKADHSFSSALTTKRFPVGPSFNRYSPAAGELAILEKLADNPRMSLIEIGKVIGSDRQTVKKRISKLIEHGVILNFGGIPNLSLLGFVTYYLLVRIAQDAPIKMLQKPFEELNNIFYAGRMVGDYDLILYLNARTPDELNRSIEVFKTDVGPYIIHYDLLVQDKVHSWRQYTSGIHRMLTRGLEERR